MAIAGREAFQARRGPSGLRPATGMPTSRWASLLLHHIHTVKNVIVNEIILIRCFSLASRFLVFMNLRVLWA